MAKETMEAVGQAEKKAQETLRQAQEECARLRQETATKKQQLLEAAVKEAKKRAEILYGVAKANGEKRRAAIQEETAEEIEQLRAQAKACQENAAEEVERLILGHPRRR